MAWPQWYLSYGLRDGPHDNCVSTSFSWPATEFEAFGSNGVFCKHSTALKCTTYCSFYFHTIYNDKTFI